MKNFIFIKILFYILTFYVINGCTHVVNGQKSINNLPIKMKAVGFYEHLPLSDENSLLYLEVPLPELQKTDVLIQVKAAGVNPIDVTLRAFPLPYLDSARIMGWDGAGIVVATGEETSLFKVGDEVYFVGDLRRNGSNAQYVAVNENMVGPKPKNFSFEEAAAMPLTTVTAYESIYDRLKLTEEDKDKSFLIINSAGGVGSIATQLGKKLGLKVIGTASRPETEAFSKQNGADIVINHKQDIISQLAAHGYDSVDFILINYDPYPYWNTLAAIIKPQGRLCMLVHSSQLVDFTPMLYKSVTMATEYMLTRIQYNTDDRIRLHNILKEAGSMFDDGSLKCTLKRTLFPLNAGNVKEAHRIMEKESMIGKLVITGF